MSFLISNYPAELDLVCRAIRKMRHCDVETLAVVIDSFRRQSKNKSERRITGKNVCDAALFIINPNDKQFKKEDIQS